MVLAFFRVLDNEVFIVGERVIRNRDADKADPRGKVAQKSNRDGVHLDGPRIFYPRFPPIGPKTVFRCRGCGRLRRVR